LLQHSEENGGVDCIGLFAGKVRRFSDNARDATGNVLKVPHMGWNRVRQKRNHPMWAGIPDNDYFYFVHSYYAAPEAPNEIVGESDYPQPFCAALSHKNVFAAQFHPEKSQRNGLQLYRNFLTWNGDA
jgi:glutamine amidotransferase